MYLKNRMAALKSMSLHLLNVVFVVVVDPVEPGQHILEGVNEEYFGDNDDGEDDMVLVIVEVDDDG